MRVIQNSGMQQGFVSFFVTFIMMIVITLIVLGFSALSRNEQQQTLNRNLSTTAFYAAESGINDATKIIQADGSTAPAQTQSCTVDNNGTNTYMNNHVLNPTSDVEYTCLNVQPTPTSLVFDMAANTVTVTPLQIASGTIGTAIFSWQDENIGNETLGTCPANSGTFTPATSWPSGCPAVVQIDIIPQTSTSSVAGLENDNSTIYLYPKENNGAPTAVPLSDGEVVAANCNDTSKACTAEVSGFASGAYYLRAEAFYLPTVLTISDISHNQFINAQAVVDSTGKAHDVLQRLEARVPISGMGGTVPQFGIQTNQSICKLITGWPSYGGGGAQDTDSCGYPPGT